VSAEVIVYILTALAAVVVVLTRLRLGGEGGAGSMDVGRGLLNVHTLFGTLALVLWVLFLVGDDESVLGGPGMGIFALACWWVTVIAGLLILVRWLPSHGRHAETARQDTWSDGPGLSVLAHVGMLVGVVVFTVAYLKAWV
jgi:hypothetical protein